MRLSIVALKLARLTYSQLASLASTVIAGFTAQVGNYPLPNPPITPDVTTDTAALNAAIAKWGTQGNRGSHNDHLSLLAARDVVRQDLFQLAVYAENTTPGDRVKLALIGWDLRAIPRHRVGVLQAVQNLHQFISRTVTAGTTKIKWGKPLNAVNVAINGYSIRRANDADFSVSVEIGRSTKTSFLDLNPGDGLRYYWVIPFNASGDGVLSDMCVASANPVP